LADEKNSRRLDRLAPYLAWGAGLGAAFSVLLFFISIIQFQSAEYMGVRDTSVQTRLVNLFQDTIYLMQLQVLSAYLAVGLALGLSIGWWFYLLARILDRGFSRLTLILSTMGCLLLVHIFFLWYAMTVYPQLFIDQFYNSGFLPGLFQTIASEYLPLWLYKLLLTLWVLSFPAMLGILAWRSIRLKLSPLPLLGECALAPISAMVVFVVWGPLPDSIRYSVKQEVQRPNVLIIAADSLRPDFMATSKGSGFMRVAARGIVYENAYTPFPRTFPAWMSMLTGQHPSTHGIRHMFPALEKLEKEYPALPRLLAEEGYDTAVISDYAGDVFGRIDLGFQHVEVPEFSIKAGVVLTMWKMHIHLLPYLMATGILDRSDAFTACERRSDPRLVTDRFLRWLSRKDSSRPFFTVLFYSTTHFPYASPYPFYRERRLEGYDGVHRYCKVGLGLDESQISSRDIQQIRLDFAASTDAVNNEVDRLLDHLSATGLLANTVIVLTADHGENLYEQSKGNSHGEFLRGREVLIIPYVFKVPERAEALLVESPVTATTMAPTLLGILGMEVPAWMEAENLAADGTFEPDGQTPIFAETGLLLLDPDSDIMTNLSIRYVSLIGRFSFNPETWELFLAGRYEKDALLAKHRMILFKNHKLLYIPTRQGVRLECYRVDEDPNDENNIYSDTEPTCNELKELLYRQMIARGDGTRINDYMVP